MSREAAVRDSCFREDGGVRGNVHPAVVRPGRDQAPNLTEICPSPTGPVPRRLASLDLVSSPAGRARAARR